MTVPRLVPAAVAVIAAFGRLGIEYYVGGSVASSVYGTARSTMDVDLVADLRLDQVPGLMATLQSTFYVDRDAVIDAVQRRASFNLIHLATMVKVDVFIRQTTPFAASEMARARSVPVETAEGTHQFRVASPEDTVLRKLLWYREGGEVSERQWSDVLGVLKVQAAGLDRMYLQNWSRQMGIADLLSDAISEAGI